mmetsp:Transcript_42665/g.123309  ORF Transcript_42665/g.123309 Transcript_42665/m.123309 type:complete len:277 (-) Transcript_42665:317-1147(-)
MPGDVELRRRSGAELVQADEPALRRHVARWPARRARRHLAHADAPRVYTLQPTDQQFDNLQGRVQRHADRPLGDERGRRVAHPLIQRHTGDEGHSVCPPEHDALHGQDREEEHDNNARGGDQTGHCPDVGDSRREPRCLLVRLRSLGGSRLELGQDLRHDPSVRQRPRHVQEHHGDGPRGLVGLTIRRHQRGEARAERGHGHEQSEPQEPLQPARLWQAQSLVCPANVEDDDAGDGAEQHEVPQAPRDKSEAPWHDSEDSTADAVVAVEACVEGPE